MTAIVWLANTQAVAQFFAATHTGQGLMYATTVKPKRASWSMALKGYKRSLTMDCCGEGIRFNKDKYQWQHSNCNRYVHADRLQNLSFNYKRF